MWCDKLSRDIKHLNSQCDQLPVGLITQFLARALHQNRTVQGFESRSDSMFFRALISHHNCFNHALISFFAAEIYDLLYIHWQNISSTYLPDAWNECGATRFRTPQIQIEGNIAARRKETSWFPHYICFQYLLESPRCMNHCCRVLPSSWKFRCDLLGEPAYLHWRAKTKKKLERWIVSTSLIQEYISVWKSFFTRIHLNMKVIFWVCVICTALYKNTQLGNNWDQNKWRMYISIISWSFRLAVQLPHFHLLIVEDDIWDPNLFWADMDSIYTSMFVFVPYEEGVIPFLQVY